MEKLISLAKRYDLVIGDRFELFYRGVIKTMNPYKYYIIVRCDKGYYYPRYYTYTPKEGEVGDYKFELYLYDDYHNLIDKSETTLHVTKALKPNRKLNILCFGDSLTYNGVWPYTAYDRFENEFGCKDSLNFMGKMKKECVGYEGFGGWKWREFCTNDCVNISSSVWVKANHNLDENDQHSTWENSGKKWVLESIEADKLKFKRGPGNYGCSASLGDVFTNFDGGLHTEDIKVLSYEYEETSPFYDDEVEGPNFKKYISKNNFKDIDYLYVLLSWNGQYIPYNTDFSIHDKYIRMILDRIHLDYPKCKVGLIGIQSPAINGGISANYGCNGAYSDVFGEVITAYNYDEYLENISFEDKYKDYVRYIDMKAQFDVENSTPAVEVKVNNRSNKVELIGTNGVHPTMEGYLQIGDAFFRALVSDINDFNNGE